LTDGVTGSKHIIFLKWFVGLVLGTINPLAIGVIAKKIRGFIRFVVNLEKMNTRIID
jgi:hypothetical protein